MEIYEIMLENILTIVEENKNDNIFLRYDLKNYLKDSIERYKSELEVELTQEERNAMYNMGYDDGYDDAFNDIEDNLYKIRR